MRKTLHLICFSLFVAFVGHSQQMETTTKDGSDSKKKIANNQLSKKQIKELRKKHAYHLANNPVNKHFLITRNARKDEALPPNQYYEQNWLMTMNPEVGRPTTEKLADIRKALAKEREKILAEGRTPGDGADNQWIERGPNNVGGRTRAIIFDPTDPTGNTVIAGGVSGGLWKNTNISSSSSTWTRISTLPEHLNVQNIAIDPNNTSTWYVGTGESYVFGDVQGNGVWKTTNAGVSWTRVFGGGTLTTVNNSIKNLSIISPSNSGVVGQYSTGTASWVGGAVTAPIINKSIVLMDDGTAPNEDGCTATSQNYANKIVLIRRGSCTFESKSVIAQNAGALAVIIMNNAAGVGPMGMADDAASTGTIPTISISKEDGDLLMANLTNLTGTIQPTQPGEFNGNIVSGVQHINDIVIKNNGGVSDIYIALGDGLYSNSRNNTLFSPTTYGLYKSSNGGTSWTKLTLPVSDSGNETCPNDIEIGIDGKIWVSSLESWTFGDGGGRVFLSTDNGSTFALKHTVTGNGGGSRVEIEASNTNANRVYILSQLNQATSTAAVEVKLEVTNDAFASAPSVLTLPVGNEARETTYGFTGAQAFYDLMIESDPSNDQILYVGGIDLYRSTNGGSNWTTISDWTINVHADQHAMVFMPGNPSAALFGNDGGVFYCGNLSAATETSTTAITSRNNGFNVTQFVGVAVMPNGVSGMSNDFFVAGAQDNGSQYFSTSQTSTIGATTASTYSAFRIQSGDGGIPLFSQDSDKYCITNYVYNDNLNYRSIGTGGTTRTLSNGTANMGLFYPAMALDNNLDMVYSDFSGGTTVVYQIRRYSNIKSGIIGRTNLTNALLTTYPTALHVSKYTTATTTLFVGTMNGKLLKVTNANATATWADITGAQFVGSISDIELGLSEQQIFVTMYNYGVNNVWYTSNGGTSWSRIEGDLPDMPVNCILQNPLNTAEIMVGTDLGVWYANGFNPAGTADQSLTWKQSFNGMSNVRVTDMDLQPNSPTAPTAYNVYAATYGRGVFSGPLTSVVLSSVENETVGKTFNVYPTISNGEVTLGSTKYFGKTSLEVFDVVGKKVYSNVINIDSNDQKINFGSLSSGNYILKLSGEGFDGIKKIIIK